MLIEIESQVTRAYGQVEARESLAESSVESVGQRLHGYLDVLLLEPDNKNIQNNPYGENPWGEVLPKFTREFKARFEKVEKHRDLIQLMQPVITRGIEFISGGVVSAKDLEEGERRGLRKNGTWPDAPGAGFWDPRERSPRMDPNKAHERKRKTEGEIINKVVEEVLLLPTTASEVHIGRVITMALPALFAWSDLGREFSSSEEIIHETVEAAKRMLDAEKIGRFDIVTFGCEPYQYRYAPNTTTRHVRRSEFGSNDTIRIDAIQGSFRGIRRILEPLQLSGIDTRYKFHTSFGTDWNLIQRQVMPDTISYYRRYSTPEDMLGILRKWQGTIESVGNEEFVGSGIELEMVAMEDEVVLPALVKLSEVLENCGMDMPEDRTDFYYGSEAWFLSHMHQLDFLAVSLSHPDAKMLLEFVLNEEEWSRKHPEAYASEKERIAQAALLSFFEYQQYERINKIINKTDGIAVGVEIDEELIAKIRLSEQQRGIEQSPLVWGRPPRYTVGGEIGGVGYRQPWFYEK